MSDSPDLDVVGLALGQAGCVSRAQARAAGFSDDMIAQRLRSGRWQRAHPGVYTLVGSQASWFQDIWAAVLAAGRRQPTVRDVVVTHETALLLHGVEPDRLPRYPVTLTVPNGRHRRVNGTVIHQLDDLAPRHLTTVKGLPVSRPSRAVVDVSRHMGERRLRDLLDELIVGRIVTLDKVSACLAEVARPGKPGLAALAELLDLHGSDYVPPHSELERALFEAIATAGLPEPARQHPLPNRHSTDEFADGAYLDSMILLEADGRRWHTRIRDLRRDHTRDADASQAGWLTLRFMYEQIVATPRDVTDTIAAVRETRLAQLTLPSSRHRP